MQCGESESVVDREGGEREREKGRVSYDDIVTFALQHAHHPPIPPHRGLPRGLGWGGGGGRNMGKEWNNF